MLKGDIILLIKCNESGMQMKKDELLTRTCVVVLIAFICSALWGSAFSGVKVGYERLGINSSDWASQMVFAGVRFAAAGIMTIAIGSISSRKLLVPGRQGIPKVIVISLFQTIFQYFFYYIGLAHTTGVKAAVIVAANVFTAILISSLIYKIERLTVRKILGCVIGFSGIVLINLGGLTGGAGFSLLGDGFIFLCTIASGFSSVLMKKYSSKENPVMLSGWQFLFGGLVMCIIGAAFGGGIGKIDSDSVLILIYLSFVSAAAYSLWSVLLKYNPVSRVAVFGFMNPICGVIISGIVLKETDYFGMQAFIALVLVCAGIYIVNKNNSDTELKNH